MYIVERAKSQDLTIFWKTHSSGQISVAIFETKLTLRENLVWNIVLDSAKRLA